MKRKALVWVGLLLALAVPPVAAAVESRIDIDSNALFVQELGDMSTVNTQVFVQCPRSALVIVEVHIDQPHTGGFGDGVNDSNCDPEWRRLGVTVTGDRLNLGKAEADVKLFVNGVLVAKVDNAQIDIRYR